jgi:selenocysteine-specific elongation factor
LPIDRVFSMKGFGTVVTGTLGAGEIGTDGELVVLPSGLPVKVRGLQVHGRKVARALAGQRTAINLGGVDVGDLARGDELVTPGAFEATRRLDASLELLPDVRPLRHGARVRFHEGTAEIMGRVAIASVEGSAAAGELPAGTRAYVRIRLERPAVIARGDRYIIRAYSPPVTIGGGQIVDPHPPRGGIRTAAARGRFEKLDPARGAAPVDAAAVILEEAALVGVPESTLVTRAGVRPDDLAAAVAALVERGTAVQAGHLIVDAHALAGARARLVTAIGDHHRAHPLSDGLPREEARERLFGAASEAFVRALDDLVAAGKVIARDRLALTSHTVSLSPEEERARRAIERAFHQGGLTPPDPATVLQEGRIDPQVGDRILKLLLRQKILVRLETLYFHTEALQRLKDDVGRLKQGSGSATVDVGAFKERYGVSRKFAIPLLEFLDRERVTRRVGEKRVVL